MERKGQDVIAAWNHSLALSLVLHLLRPQRELGESGGKGAEKQGSELSLKVSLKGGQSVNWITFSI